VHEVLLHLTLRTSFLNNLRYQYVRIIVSIIFLFQLLSISSQTNPILILDWEDSTTCNLKNGELICKANSPKKKAILNVAEYQNNDSSKQAYLDQFISQYEALPEGKQDVLFYIHGFGAHRKKYIKLNSGTIYGEILSRSTSDIGMLTSLVWDGGMIYVPTIPKAVEIGEYYGDVIADCIKAVKSINPDADIHLLTHSMGNRVFIGVFNRLIEEFDESVFTQHIMAAPDIEPTVFDQDQPLEDINSISQHVTIYRHYLDRVLGSSSSFSGEERLGLTSLTVEHLDRISADITLVDCSYLNDNERFDPGNHNYYYQSPTVRSDIFNILMENDDLIGINRSQFKHPKRFILEFENKYKVSQATN